MTLDIEALADQLRRDHPTSHVRLLPEPAMFLRSNTGRSYHAEGMPFSSNASALSYASAYMQGLLERIGATEGFELNQAHPWIIGIHPGDLTSSPLIFIFGNIIRSGAEAWIQIGFPRYESLEFPS
jgi:hypothetical protein